VMPNKPVTHPTAVIPVTCPAVSNVAPRDRYDTDTVFSVCGIIDSTTAASRSVAGV
jgi:hypothetical protein